MFGDFLFRVDVSLSSGLANGEVVQGAHDNLTWDYKVNVTADTNTAYNTVHANLSGSGNGSTGIDDTVWAFYANGTPEVARTFVLTFLVGTVLYYLHRRW